MKQFDRFFVAYNQLSPLRADGRGGGVVPEVLKFLPVLLAAIFLQFVFASLLINGYIWLTGIWWFSDSDIIAVVINLFSTLGMIAAALLCLWFTNRKLSTAGFTRPFLSEYAVGALAGLAVFSLAVGIACAAGTLTVSGLSDGFAPGPWLLILAGFLVQGMSEELLCRGLLMLNVARKNSVLAGILTNSLLFAALHLLNDGITPLAFLNLFLYGVLASLCFLWRGNIWGIAAFHSMWNFAQGNVYGILVSGGAFGTSLLSSVSDPGAALINGGDFGLEGGLAVTVVLVIGIAFIVWRNLRRLARTPMPLEEPPC